MMTDDGTMWEVVGGGDKGGILVRKGQGTDSEQCKERLSTGALVKQVDRAGDRIEYKLVKGAGPEVGWVSIKITGKDLLVETDKTGNEPDEPEFKGPRLVATSFEDWLPVPHPATDRCKKEWDKKSVPWQGMAMDHFMANYMNNKPGTRYGFKFPHTLEQLTSSEYGPAWMTKAFQASGVLSADNKITQIVSTKQLSGGGAADKALVVVKYAKPSKELHTHLFMKYPYPCEGPRRSDRVNSSVMLQQDCMEVDALRLLEASMPFRVTKYYFADISNETTNFIILTEFVHFGDPKKALKDFAPWEVEPPYEKFMDDEQWGDKAWEYYQEMTKACAKMAGWYKAGKFGDPEELRKYFPKQEANMGAAGISEKEFQAKIKHMDDFISNSAKVLFPPEVLTPAAMTELKRVLNVANTYTLEFHLYTMKYDADMSVMMHGNMNADNTFWTRDPDGKLHIGVLDWGGLGIKPFPGTLWWCDYASEFHFLEKHMDEMLELFCKTFEESGGPKSDFKFVKECFLISAINQCLGLMGAIPQIYRVVPKKVWPEVKDRHFPKLKDSFLTRMYVQGFVLIATMVHKWNLGKMLDDILKENNVKEKPLTKLD